MIQFTAAITVQSPPQRGSGWRRFSLRALLVGMTLIAVCLGIWSERARRQRAAVAALRDMGAQVYYDYQLVSGPEGGPIALPAAVGKNGSPAEPSVPGWLVDAAGIDYFHGATVVWVYFPHRFDTAAHLKQLPALEEVHVPLSCVQDELPFAEFRRELRGVHVVAELAVAG